jgi:hypothetical protein
MAERIDDIISPKAFEQVQKMNADIGLLVKNFESSANAAKLISAALSGSNSMKTVTENIKAAAGEVAKLEQAQKRLEFANSESGQELANLNYQISEANRLNRALAKEMTSAEGSSSKLSAQLIRLRAQFDGMSEALRSSPLGQELAKRINTVDTALKTLDSNTGRFQRNVGNYATATNSLSQVLRELPGFTYSAQTGILGISNNLPILIDSFRATAMSANATTGAIIGTTGAFKIFLGSLFTWQSILTIAIGLFTIFSKEIFDFIGGANKATEEISELNKAIGTETGKIEALTRQIDNHNISNADRLKAAEELKKLYPTALKNYSAEEIAAGKAAGAIMKIKDALIAVAMARAAQSDLEKKAAERYDLEKKLALKKIEMIKAEQEEQSLLEATRVSSGAKSQQFVINSYNKQVNANAKLREELNALQSDAIGAEMAMNSLAEKIGNMTSRASAGGLNISGEDISKDAPKAKKEKDDKTKAKDVIDVPNQMSNEEADDLKKYYEDVNKWIEKYSKEMLSDPKVQERINQDIAENMPMPEDLPDVKATKLGEELKTYYAKKEKDARLKITKEEQQKKTQLVVENTAKMVQMAAEIMSIAADIQFQNEMAMIDKRTKALEESYDSEIERLERSGMSKEKIEKEKQRLEAQTEAQRKNIDQQRIQAQKRKARADKAADIANIITSTAAAVVGQLAAKPVGPWNIALAAIMGALGAANLTRAIATPLPQFAKGTNSAPGGLAEVGEKGTELVIEPSGKKYLTPNKSTIMNVKKGSKIIPHHELMNQVRLAAMVKLSGQDSVSEMDYGNALIQAVIEQTEEQKRTRRAMERMNTTVIVNDNSSFQKWVTTYCK